MKAKRIIACGVVLALSIFTYIFGLFNTAQESLTDRLFIRDEQPKNIIIVAIDDVSLKEIGQWPWKRETFGKAISSLQNAKVIAIDIDFSEVSRFGDSDDQILADAIKRSTVPVVLPIELREDGNVRVRPLPSLLASSTSSTHLGFVNVIKNVDGSIRKIETINKENKSFSAAIFNLSHEAGGLKADIASNLPQTMRINYKGPVGSFFSVPFVDVVNGTLPRDLLNDSYVLIGVTAPSLRDISKTPFGEMPGVEVHANALSTILDGQYLVDVSKPIGATTIALVSLLASLLVLHIRRFRYLGLGFLVLIISTILVGVGFFSYGIILPLFYLLFATVLSFGGMLGFQYITESKEKRFIRQSFQYYLSPAVIDQILEHPEKLSLGGEKCEVSILFSDIRGFTTLSEGLSPEGLVTFMNEYLTVMTDVIMAHGGVVDKYIGDAIMAFWGAPLQNDRHAVDAVLAANGMMEKLKEMNVEWQKRGIPALGIGIGINTGEVIVGNMGSSKRFNYTIMGDEVNFSSRLEGLNKMYGTECIVSESTVKKFEKVKIEVGMDMGNTITKVVFRPLDDVMVKGKAVPKSIFELVGSAVANSEWLLKDFEKGKEAYQKGEWDRAIGIFESILSKCDDGPTKTLLARSKEFKEKPPEKWNGVYEFHSK